MLFEIATLAGGLWLWARSRSSAPPDDLPNVDDEVEVEVGSEEPTPAPIPRPGPPAPKPAPAPGRVTRPSAPKPGPGVPAPPKPAPKPVPKPPAQLTELEKQTAAMVAATRPQEFPGAPTDDLRYRGKRLERDWLANWVYWTLYVDPSSAWVSSGQVAGPWKFAPGVSSPFTSVWNRIRAFLDTFELGASPAPAPTPTPAPTPVTPPEALTPVEKATAQMAAKAQPATFPDAPTDDLRNRGSRTLENWLANWVYWSMYVMPSSSWVKAGNAPGPWKTTPGTVWAAKWQQLRNYIGTLGLTPNKPADEKDEAAAAFKLTQAEREAADFALNVRPTWVAESVVPAPTNTRRPDHTDKAWLTNYAYWMTYRSPTSAWVSGGNAPGPVATPPGSSWATKWSRIGDYIEFMLG